MKILRIDSTQGYIVPIHTIVDGAWQHTRDINILEVCDVPITESCLRRWELMGEDCVTLSFSSSTAITFRIGDFLWFEGERFTLCSTYVPSDNADSGGYDYNMTFSAHYMIANNRTFKLTTQGLELSWVLNEKLDKFMGLVLDNFKANDIKHWLFDDGVIYEHDYEFAIDDFQPEKETGSIRDTYKTLEFKDVKLIDAITTLAQKWNAEWYVVKDEWGYATFRLGRCESEDVIDLHRDVYEGEEGNIVSIDGAASADNQGTRLYVYGSTQNVPSRYDKELRFYMSGQSGDIIWDKDRLISPTMFNEGEDVVIEHVPNHIISPITLSGTYSRETNYIRARGTSELDAVGSCQVGYNLNLGIHLKGTRGVIYMVETVVTFNDVSRSETFKGSYDDLVSGVLYLSSNSTINTKLNGDGCTYSVDVAVEYMKDGKTSKIPLVDGVDVNIIYSPILTTTRVRTKMLIENQEVDCIVNPFMEDISLEQSGRIQIDSSYIATNRQYELPYISKHSVPLAYFSPISNYSMSQSEKRLHMDMSTLEGDTYIKRGLYIQDSSISDAEAIEKTLVLDDIFPKCKLVVNSVSSITSETKDEEGTVTKHVYYSVGVSIDDAEQTPFVFSPNYILDNEEITMKFESGLLNGYTFGVVFYPDGRDGTEHGHQVFELIADTSSIEIPNVTIYPKIGDKVILFGWDATSAGMDQLVKVAEAELLARGIEYLKRSKIESTTYTCPMISSYVYLRGLVDDVWYYKRGIFAIGQSVNLRSPLLHNGVRRSRIIGAEIKLDIPYDTPKYTIGESPTYSIFSDTTEKESVSLGMGDNIKVSSSDSGGKLKPMGSSTRPIWINANKEPQSVDGIEVPNDISSGGDISAEGGVSAHGITDLSVEGGSGVGVGAVLRYDELTTSEPEDTSVVATAYSVAKIKEDIGLNDIEEFITNRPYERGDVVRYNGKGWRFVTNKEAGSWDPSYCEYLRYASLAKPLPIQISEIKKLK